MDSDDGRGIFKVDTTPKVMAGVVRRLRHGPALGCYEFMLTSLSPRVDHEEVEDDEVRGRGIKLRRPSPRRRCTS